MEDTFVTEKCVHNNFSHKDYLLVGNSDGQYNILLKFSNDYLKMNLCTKEIIKVELAMYLSDLNLKKCGRIILNIKENLEPFQVDKVTFCNAPKYSKNNNKFLVNKKCIGKYIFFDITNFVIFWLNNPNKNFGVTIIAENCDFAIGFLSSNSVVNNPYLRINHKCNKEIKIGNSCGKVLLDKKEECSYLANTNKNSKYGTFINYSGMKSIENNCTYVLFDECKYGNMISLCSEKKAAIIHCKGKYSVNVSLNVRCDKMTNMYLKLNDNILEYTKNQVSFDECTSNFSAIIDVTENDSKLFLVIEDTNVLFVSIGIAAVLNIVSIC